MPAKCHPHINSLAAWESSCWDPGTHMHTCRPACWSTHTHKHYKQVGVRGPTLLGPIFTTRWSPAYWPSMLFLARVRGLQTGTLARLGAQVSSLPSSAHTRCDFCVQYLSSRLIYESFSCLKYSAPKDQIHEPWFIKTCVYKLCDII